MDLLPYELLIMIYERLPVRDAARLSFICADICIYAHPRDILLHASKFIHSMKIIRSATYTYCSDDLIIGLISIRIINGVKVSYD